MKELTVSRTFGTANTARIDHFEKDIGSAFPSSYKEFLSKYNGGGFEEEIYPLIEPISNDRERGGEANIAWFYALYDGEYGLEQNYFRMKERLPKDMLPIGEGSGGDIICLAISGENYGKVYFWNHEEEAPKGEKPTYNNLYLIANSFSDFINSLSEYQEEE